MARPVVCGRCRWLASLGWLLLAAAAPARAALPQIRVIPQPMIATGLAARHEFEAWFVLDVPLEPAAPGYAVPEGAEIRVVFPPGFTPMPAAGPSSVLLYGWPQRGIPVAFTVARDPRQPRAIVLHLAQAIPSGLPGRPGLKAIHLRSAERNPVRAGAYPITLTFRHAGALDGSVRAIAQIAPAPQPNIAAYNQLHEHRDEDYQHVGRNGTVAIPLDFLVTLPGQPRAELRLEPAPGGLRILADNAQIGTIRIEGVPLTLTPERFGPGFARLGIVRVAVRAGGTAGTAQVIATLAGGETYRVTVIVE